MLIQDRVRMILKSQSLTASQFADKIGVKRSNLSHVLSGRNKPSLDFLDKILRAYPNVDAKWLITGDAASSSINNLESDHQSIEQSTSISKKDSVETTRDSVNDAVSALDGQKKIRRVLVFYTDDSFDAYSPNNQ